MDELRRVRDAGAAVTWRKHPAFSEQALSPGERAADWMRNRMGSWAFVISFLVFMCAWAAVNTVALATGAFDPYPYILLNLFLSMLAGLQGAILLIAAKRQDAIASTLALHSYEMLQQNTDLTRKVHELTQALHSVFCPLPDLARQQLPSAIVPR